MTRLLRCMAVGIAAAAFLDPSLDAARNAPVKVRLYLQEADPAARTVRDRLRDALGNRAELVSGGNASAAVMVGGFAESDAIQPDRPISSISLIDPPDVAIAGIPDTVRAIAGRPLDVVVQLEGRGLAGLTSTIVLEDRGVDVARAEHAWTGESRASIVLPYVAATSAGSVLTVRVDPVPGEGYTGNNRAGVRILPLGRAIEVAVFEPRPSWAAGFVRRSLESDPACHVSSILHLARGIAARTGEPPRQVTAADLERFDIVLVGAPDELREGEVRALREFTGVRGGTVVLLPDRRPAGPYADLFPEPLRSRSSDRLTERLLRQPERLQPAGLMASEIVAADGVDALQVLAAASDHPVVFSWPIGDGRVVFSGALDAWRYRGDRQSGIDRFWRTVTIDAGLAAPPRLQLTLSPSVARPNHPVRVTVRVRRTEMRSPSAGEFAMPAVAAQIVSRDGTARSVRLWPTPEIGVFAGEAHPADTGTYDIRVTTDSGASADTTLFVDAAAPVRSPTLDMTGMASRTGGVEIAARDLTPLVQHLTSLPRPVERRSLHPMRSAWWMVPFAAAACAEWTLRRQRGLR